MTDKQRVFCKDCRWYKEDESPFCNIGHTHKCYFDSKETVDYHPVGGEIRYKPPTGNCMDKNARCDCSDYEAKEKDDELD